MCASTKIWLKTSLLRGLGHSLFPIHPHLILIPPLWLHCLIGAWRGTPGPYGLLRQEPGRWTGTGAARGTAGIGMGGGGGKNGAATMGVG